jgi:DNA-binding MarR family transcriptional regulator
MTEQLADFEEIARRLPQKSLEQLVRTMPALLFAFQALTAEANALLNTRGLGRAHYRVLSVVAALPNISVNELLSVLQITNQAVSRCLTDLQRKKLLRMKPDSTDRRRRHLFLTTSGRKFEHEVMAKQLSVLLRARLQVGDAAFDGYYKTLVAISSLVEVAPAAVDAAQRYRFQPTGRDDDN